MLLLAFVSVSLVIGLGTSETGVIEKVVLPHPQRGVCLPAG